MESSCVKYLGVLLDRELSFHEYIVDKCKKAMFNIYRLRQLRIHLSRKSLEQLVHSLVLSQLDYCSILLYGLPKSSLIKLQRVQNCAAKLILNKRKYDSSTACLKELHWLPIKSRILFRLLCMTYKCINNQGPSYLSSYFIQNNCRYSLRSSSSSTFCVPKTNRKTYGDRAFSIAGPREWNNLPNNIRSAGNFHIFKKLLKTDLFKIAFS